MDIENFIKETLLGIKKGLIAANLECKQLGNKELSGHKIGDFALQPRQEGKGINSIKFDVAVVAEQETGGSKKGGLKVAFANVDGEKINRSTDQTISHIEFQIDILNNIIN